MHKRGNKEAILAAALVIAGTAVLTLPALAGQDLIDILPDLVPATFVSPTGVDMTVRPQGAGTTTDLGTAFGTFDTASDLGAISSSAFQEFQNLPVGSAVAAFTYTFDAQQNIFVRSKEGLGPVFADRAQTMGKGKLNVGVSWSHISFDEIEGTDLDDVPIPTRPGAVIGETFSPINDPSAASLVAFPLGSNSESYTLIGGQGFESFVLPNGFLSNNFTNSMGDPLADIQAFAQAGAGGLFTTSFTPDTDISAQIELDVELINLYASYGLTDNLDVGILLPILKVDLDTKVTYETFDFDDPALAGNFPDGCDSSSPGCELAAVFNLSIDAINTAITDGDDPGEAVLDVLTAVELTRQLKDSGQSVGIGDLMVRGKYRFLDSKFIDMAARVDIAFPTGDEDNFRGVGEYMVGFNLIMSKNLGFFAPHANIGLQARTGGKENHQFRWMVGSDFNLTDRISGSFDFVGNEDLYHDGIGDTQMAVAPGLKFNPFSNLVVAIGVILRVNHQGLRADVIPSLSVEYTFF